MSQDKDLERFLRAQLFRERENPLEKFVLRHALAGSRGNEVEEFPLSGTITTEMIPVMRDEVLASAQRDADGLGTKLQSYVLVAVELDGKTGARFAFRVRGDGDDEEGGEEPANEKGLLAQMMRHNEALMRLAISGNSAVVGTLSRQLEESHRSNEKLLAQRQESFVTLEEAKSLQHEREINLLTVGNAEERKTEATSKLMTKLELLFPVLFNKLAGKKTMSEEDQSLLAPFVESLSEGQIQRIAQQLAPEQQVSLMQIYQAVKVKAPPAGNGAS